MQNLPRMNQPRFTVRLIRSLVINHISAVSKFFFIQTALYNMDILFLQMQFIRRESPDGKTDITVFPFAHPTGSQFFTTDKFFPEFFRHLHLPVPGITASKLVHFPVSGLIIQNYIFYKRQFCKLCQHIMGNRLIGFITAPNHSILADPHIGSMVAFHHIFHIVAHG